MEKQHNNCLLRLGRLDLLLLRSNQLLGSGALRVLLPTLHDKNQDQQAGDNRVTGTNQPEILVEGELGIRLGRVNHSPQSGDSDSQVNRNGKHEHSEGRSIEPNRTLIPLVKFSQQTDYTNSHHRVKKRLNGGWGIVKEGVEVRGILGGLGRDFDMQYAVVDGEAHKDNPKEETNCGEDTSLAEAHCRVGVLGMREKREGSPFAGTLQFWECSTG